PAGDALGAQLRMTTDLDTLWRTVVGIVGDIRQTAPELEPRHAMYLPHAQFPSSDPDGRVGQLNLVVRTAGAAPSSIAPAVRRVAAEIDPNLAVSNVRTMRDVTRAATSTASFQSVLFAGFAALALVLVIVGVYGVTAYLVTRRTRELGIRLALGATPGGVRGLVLREGMVITGFGLAVGIGAALAFSRVLESLLFGITARDPLTFVAVPIALALTAVLSASIPAARAGRVDPIETLRQE
ncbi:MAG: FtsX-like permease family protein, partial [Gemmatimonadetes bacterium]|nr:FtsX-like permease family protein [Gemmatimonadota bacterium]